MRFAENTQHDTSKVVHLPRKMTMDTSKVLRLPRKLQHIFWKRRKSIAPATQNDCQHVAKHVWMSRSATPATRNEATTRLKPPKMTTSAELPIGTAIRSSRERLRTVADSCARERNVERTHPQPPDPQSETGTLATHSGKTSILCETSGNFHSCRQDKKTSFAASPIDTARPRENQTREKRQVGAPKRAFRARLPPLFTLCSVKIDVFLRVFLRTWKIATSKSMFRAWLPSIFSTCQKMPRLPRNLHLVTTWRNPANAIYKKHATGRV